MMAITTERECVRAFLIKMVTRKRGLFGNVFGNARYLFVIFSSLIRTGNVFWNVFGNAALPAFLVVRLFLPCVSNTLGGAGNAVSRGYIFFNHFFSPGYEFPFSISGALP